jgi:hypothetical protein
VLQVLRVETTKRFMGADNCDRVAVAGYMFLRFFCPAIALPSKYGLTTISQANLKRTTSRGLLLIAKILQNLANGTHFMEPSMDPLNVWIDSHMDELSKFCYDMSGGNASEAQKYSEAPIDESQVAQIAESDVPSSTPEDDSVDTVDVNLSEGVIEALTNIHRFLTVHKDSIERQLESSAPLSVSNVDDYYRY